LRYNEGEYFRRFGRGHFNSKKYKADKNIQAITRKEGKLSQDSLYALHLLVDQLDGYILSIKTTPDLEVIVGNNEIYEECNRILSLKYETVNMFYDTTFCLEKPAIPIGFMIHERKFKKCHEHFLNEIKSKIPKTNTGDFCIITDRETGIINAFENCLSSAHVFISWNHFLRDLQFWLGNHNGTSNDK
ncbi:hypothetical protein MAR_031731, partial [Mya arenaria]